MPSIKIHWKLIRSTVIWLLVGCLLTSLGFLYYASRKPEKIFSFVLNKAVKTICKDCIVSVTDFTMAGAQINTEVSIKAEAQTICSSKLQLKFDLSKIFSNFSIPIKIEADSLSLVLNSSATRDFDMKSLFAMAIQSDNKSFIAPEIFEIRNGSFTLDKANYVFELKKGVDENYAISLTSSNNEAKIKTIQTQEDGIKATSYELYNLPAELLLRLLPSKIQNGADNLIGTNLTISGKIDTNYGPKTRTLNASFYNQKRSKDSANFLVELSSKDWHNKITIDKINLSIPNQEGVISAHGYVRHFPKLFGSKASIFIAYKADEINLKTAANLWPITFAPKVKDYVSNSVKAGQITNLNGTIHVKDIFSSAEDNLAFEGNSQFQSLDLKYMPDFPQVNALTGTVRFDNSSIVFDIQNGKMTDVSIEKGSSVTIDLKNANYPLIVDAKANGPIKDFIDFMPKEKVAELKKKRIDLKAINGQSNSKIIVKIPLAKESSFDNLSLDVDASLINVDCQALDKLSLQGPLALGIHKHLLSITGTPLINNNATEFHFQTHLQDKMDFDNKLTIKTIFDASNKSIDMLYDKITVSDGKIFSNIEYIVKGDIERFTINANLDAPSLYLRDLNLIKTAGKKTSFELIATNKAEEGWKTEKCDFVSDEEGIKSSSYFELSNDTHEIKKFESLIQSRGNNVKIDFILNNKESKYIIHGDHITPSKSNLLQLLNSSDISKNKKISVSLNIDRATMKNNIAFKEITGLFECYKNRCAQSALSMRIVDKRNPNSLLKIYKRDEAIILHTNNAAALLKGFDAYNNIDGGSMIVTLRPSASHLLTKSQFTGSIHIKNFKAIKTPIIAKLILMAPFTQIVEQLQGQELIRFKEFTGSFTVTNNLIEIHDSIATGDLLSATIKGRIDINKQTIDLQGKLIPKCFANKIMAKMQNKHETNPDKFQIATDYTISGKLDDPKIHVSPISVLLSIFTKPLAIL